MNVVKDMPTTLCTQKLSEEIRQTKSASTAKGYLAAINKLEEFFGRDVISINDFTTTFIEDFSKFLIAEGLSAATTSLYLRNLRALLKKSLSTNDKEVLRQVFKGVSSKNGKSSAAIGISDLTRLASANLSAYPPLRRIRSLFLFSFYACGLPIGYIRLLPKSLPASGCIPLPQNRRMTIVPQLSEVITRFETENSSNFVEYAASISEADYARGLEAIGVLMKLPVRLTPTSAAESWVAIALESGIALEHIAAIINDTTPITKHISASACHTPGTIPEKIANRLNDTSERWYAMRCFDSTPAEMQAKLAAEELAVDTFIPVQANTATTLAKDRLMSSLLFFRTSATNASVLKSRIAPGAYVFSFSSGDKKPACIPNDQMLTFMFLVNIGADTILYYYPSENGSSQQFEPKDIVEITDGSFCGNVGIVERLSKDRLRVCVRIEALNGALISAEIPAKFLKKGI